MIYKVIKYILENNTAFASAIGTDGDGDIKAYPIHPRKEVSMPFCVFGISSQNSNPNKDTASYGIIDQARLRISIYTEDLDTLISLFEKARVAMETYKGGITVDGQAIRSIDFESMNDGYNEGMGDRGALYIDADFDIWI